MDTPWEEGFWSLPDATQLAWRRWNAWGSLGPRHSRYRAVLVHGLGEHSGRYVEVARQLAQAGADVWAYDHVGHGRSEGARGGLSHGSRLVDDLVEVIDRVQALPEPKPLLLLGHSMGGLVAARLVAENRRKVDGLVLSSPALRVPMSPWQRTLLNVAKRLAPSLRVANGLDPHLISHDPVQVRAYLDDPLVHDRIGVALAGFLAEGGECVLERAPVWRVPTLLLVAGADGLVDASGSVEFAQKAGGRPVRLCLFDTLYHEVFNEVGSQAVFAELKRWLEDWAPVAVEARQRSVGALPVFS